MATLTDPPVAKSSPIPLSPSPVDSKRRRLQPCLLDPALPGPRWPPLHGVLTPRGNSDYASSSSSRALGGLSMLQILRYRDSPVGAYDEMILAPGSFELERPQTPRPVYMDQQYRRLNNRPSVSSRHRRQSRLCL
ncbi:hypothetical protein NM208_g14313 [Fusarium decemcellulare]|uniref:Uncharacterized protein n=1 Tax=Fusarium decemcellulare TaxID=57161 RepID=A0ACC1RJ56_9HYPO|nr:hypothetical protein NM208_g14313 [Fusarium decemcellulare]